MADIAAEEHRAPSGFLALVSRIALGLLLVVFGPIMCLVFAALPAAGVVHFILKPTGVLAICSSMTLAAAPSPEVALPVALARNLAFSLAPAALLFLFSLRAGFNPLRLALHIAISALTAAGLCAFGVALLTPLTPATVLPLREMLAATGMVWPPSADEMGAVAVAIWSIAILVGAVAGVFSAAVAGAVTRETHVDDAVRAGIGLGVETGAIYGVVLIVGAAFFGIG
jgi:hypothetical protein